MNRGSPEPKGIEHTMTTPTPENPGVSSNSGFTISVDGAGSTAGSVVDTFAVDLSDVLTAPRSAEVVDHVRRRRDLRWGGVTFSCGVEISTRYGDEVAQVITDAGDQFAAEGQFEAYGSYDAIDLGTDADTGPRAVSIEPADVGATAYLGVDGAGALYLDFSMNPDGGTQEIGADTGCEFAAGTGFDIGYDLV